MASEAPPPPAIQSGHEVRARPPAKAMTVVLAGLPSALGSGLGFATTLITVSMIAALGQDEALIRSHYVPWGLLLAGVILACDLPMQIVIAKRGYSMFPQGIFREVSSYATVPAIVLAALGMAAHWLVPKIFVSQIPPGSLDLAGKFFALMTFAAIPMLLAAMLEAALRGSGRLWIAGVAGLVRTAATIAAVAALFAGAQPSILYVPLVMAVLAFVEVSVLGRLLVHWSRPDVPVIEDIPGPSYAVLLSAVGIPVFLSYLLLSGTATAQLQTLTLLGQNAGDAIIAMGLYHTWQTFAVVTTVGLASGGSVVILRAGLNPQQCAALAIRTLGVAALLISVGIGAVWVFARRLVALSTPHERIEALLLDNAVILTLVCLATCVSVYAITLLEGLAHAKTALVSNTVYLAIVIAAGWGAVKAGGDFSAFAQTLSVAAALGVIAAPVLLLTSLKRTRTESA